MDLEKEARLEALRLAVTMARSIPEWRADTVIRAATLFTKFLVTGNRDDK